MVARVARRFMPRIKTESEVGTSGHRWDTYSSFSPQVATLEYIRTKTNVPVPDVFFYDSSPYNEIGYEYIVMSKVRPKRIISSSLSARPNNSIGNTHPTGTRHRVDEGVSRTRFG